MDSEVRGGKSMDKCKDCIYYDDTLTFPGTGYCKINRDYVGEDDTCEDWEGDYE